MYEFYCVILPWETITDPSTVCVQRCPDLIEARPGEIVDSGVLMRQLSKLIRIEVGRCTP